MINVYYHKGKELGFTFHQFETDRYVNDFQAHEDAPHARAYLRGSKVDLVTLNLEHFVRGFENSDNLQDKLEVEAQERMRACVSWCLENRSEYDKIFKVIFQCEKFMVTLVNSVSDSQRAKAIMQMKILINFVRAELDDKSVSHKGVKAS
ncbi:MAG: hypothetical protein COB15_09565 [Flavobacteriales bacterium]|nr:MAG: hypothetical protein COB15_09565 [Flavobacteriales bacterium]